MLKKYHKFRKLYTLICNVLLVLLNMFLFDVREIWVIFIYIFVSLILNIATFKRNFERKLPNFNV